ncbi:MAG: sulfotransferase [Ilumatobacteraceae bacterium]
MRTKEAHRRTAVARVVTEVRKLPVFRSYPTLYVGSAVKGFRQRDELAGVRTFVIFIGHPRSGHSLVGSLLDAHPNIVVSHELDVLRFVAAGYRRTQLIALVVDHARANAVAGRKSWGYSYAVPGQWQGRFEDLQVVGDKRGRLTTVRLGEHPELLDRLAEAVGMPVAIVQVVRDPLDNIATMWRRADHSLDQQVDLYFTLTEACHGIEARVAPERFHRLHLEDMVADPHTELTALCRFIDVPADPAYLDACAAIMFDSPKQTRGDAPWTPELLADVRRRAAATPWLDRYTAEPGPT